MSSQIARNFSNSANTYDRVGSIQSKVARDLFSFIPQSDYKNIIDIGTGTGYMLNILAEKYPDAGLTANDLSAEMLAMAKDRIANKVTTITGDIQDLVLSDNYDLLTSSLCFQWVDDIYSLLSNLKTNCCGHLAFSTLLDSSFEPWQQAHAQLGLEHKSRSYNSLVEYRFELAKVFPKNSIDFYFKRYDLKFNNAIELLSYFKLLGANTPLERYSVKELRSLVVALGSDILLNYDVLFVVINNVNNSRVD